MPHMNRFKLIALKYLVNDLNRAIEISRNLSSLNWILKSCFHFHLILQMMNQIFNKRS